MTTILDLGGAPANEPCAQLGQTPDFATLNLLEVEAYRAALVARHGPPPPGCRFQTIVNNHDFGRYRTLGLAVDTAADPAAERYAEAVEDGLGSWLEAGFTPPVSYRGPTAHVDRHDVAEIVVGALQTTRPDFDGRFPVADFAVLHANLRAGFQTEAALYDERCRGVAPPPVTSADPRFRDEAGVPLAGIALARAVCHAAIAALAPHLEKVGATKVVIRYDGGGDEGQINEITAEAADGTPVALPEVASERFRIGFDGRVSVDINSLANALEEIGYEALGAYYSGWENGDGAFGSVIIDLATRTAALECNAYVTTSEQFTHEL